MPEYAWNGAHLTRGGAPWLPVMGEMHYARCPRREWRRELQKMKACGVDIVSTYVFWRHHEREEGVFDFSDRLDVGTFIALCGELSLPVWLRIGPWCHGECRHGGFPDWLQDKGIPLRCDDARYLAYVRALWEQLFEQVRDHIGRHIIGIQIENEFGHCGGEGGDAHMYALESMARAIGFDAPYFSATGWGGAYIGGMLPVMSCYCDAPWDRSLKPLPLNPNYLFSHERNDVDVGSDFRRGQHLTFDADKYPYLMAEMGGGIGCTFHRRPVAEPADTGAMTLVKLGSGANLLGYYMFHGGTNPTLFDNETRASGSWCQTPVLSYAPRSPIGEYGQVTELAKEIKLFALFARSFGAELAPMPAQIPSDNAANPEDAQSPRYAYRMHNGRGFVFVNNYQRGKALPARVLHTDVLGDIAVPGGFYGMLPVRLPVGGALVSSTNAVPLCRLNGRDAVFYCDGEPQYTVEGELNGARIVTLSRREALDAWLCEEGGKERLVIAPVPPLRDENGWFFITDEDVRFYDALTRLAHTLPVPRQAPPRVWATLTHDNFQCETYELTLEYGARAEDILLCISYIGSIAELWRGEEMIADDLSDGGEWTVRLAQFDFPARLTLRVYALFEGMPVWMQRPPVFDGGRALRLENVCIRRLHRLDIPQEMLFG